MFHALDGDVRPEPEYAAGHVLRARSVPTDQLDRWLDDVPRNSEIVAYCRGPYCVFADDAVRAARAQGLAARRLEDGFPEWRRAGLPVSAGNGARDA